MLFYLDVFFRVSSTRLECLSNVIKKRSKNIITILGGIHATAYPHEILTHCNNIDYIILGEGENTLQALLFQLQKGIKNFNKLDGFAFRNASEKVVINKKTQFINNLDEIPFPAYHLIKFEKLLIRYKDMA